MNCDCLADLNKAERAFKVYPEWQLSQGADRKRAAGYRAHSNAASMSPNKACYTSLNLTECSQDVKVDSMDIVENDAKELRVVLWQIRYKANFCLFTVF